MQFKCSILICLILSTSCFCLPVQAQSNLKKKQNQPQFQFEPLVGNSVRFSEVVVDESLPDGFAADELTAKIPENLNSTWLGSFTYGDDRSRSVAVMIAGDSDSRQLFVDCNRDRVFQVGEKFNPVKTDKQPGPTWQVKLDSEFVGKFNQNQHAAQQVQFRWDETDTKLYLATYGTMQGTTEFDGRTCAVRYEDRNANGRWFDSEDRLFVDWNHDGRIDSLLERLPCVGMRKISRRLIAIGGDPMGAKLQLTEVEDQGLIIPKMIFTDSEFKIKSMDAVLASESGMQARITSLDEPVKVPIGKWRPQRLRMEVSDARQTFSFAFDAAGSQGEFTEILADESAPLDLLGELELSAISSLQRRGASTTITITPMLTSHSGLYLVQSKCGKSSAIAENRLIATSSGQGQRIGVGSSGFS